VLTVLTLFTCSSGLASGRVAHERARVSEQFPFVDRIFVAFRASVGDALLMRDIVNGLGQTLSQSRDVRAQFFFDLYDISGDGTLDVSELVHMLLCSKQHVNASAAAVLRSLRTMDTDMDGRVTMEEFRARAMRDPEVLQAVFRCAAALTCLLSHALADVRCCALLVFRTPGCSMSPQRPSVPYLELTRSVASPRLGLGTWTRMRLPTRCSQVQGCDRYPQALVADTLRHQHRWAESTCMPFLLHGTHLGTVADAASGGGCLRVPGQSQVARYVACARCPQPAAPALLPAPGSIRALPLGLVTLVSGCLFPPPVTKRTVPTAWTRKTASWARVLEPS